MYRKFYKMVDFETELNRAGRVVKAANLHLIAVGSSLAQVTCETSQVLLEGGQVFYSRGSPVFAPPND